jgi:hypothetical protein
LTTFSNEIQEGEDQYVKTWSIFLQTQNCFDQFEPNNYYEIATPIFPNNTINNLTLCTEEDPIDTYLFTFEECGYFTLENLTLPESSVARTWVIKARNI